MLNIQLCQKMLMHMLENFFGDRKLEIEYLLVQTWDNIICPLIWDSALSHCWVTIGTLIPFCYSNYYILILNELFFVIWYHVKIILFYINQIFHV